MEALHGIDGVLYFKKNDNWVVYGCCETVDVVVNTSLVSTQTIGDGQWERSAVDGLGYNVSFSGIVQYDDEANRVNHFELLEYQANGLEIEWYLSFKQNDQATELTSLWGSAFIVTSTVAAPVDFVNTSMELKGQGQLMRGSPPVCTAMITSHTLTRQGLTFIYHVAILAVTTGSVPRYDWRLDGQGTGTTFSTGWPVNVSEASNFIFGPHLLEIWPVCANGIRGTRFTRNFTVPFG